MVDLLCLRLEGKKVKCVVIEEDNDTQNVVQYVPEEMTEQNCDILADIFASNQTESINMLIDTFLPYQQVSNEIVNCIVEKYIEDGLDTLSESSKSQRKIVFNPALPINQYTRMNVQRPEELDISNKRDLEDYFEKCFLQLDQKFTKRLAMKWIQLLEPQKKHQYPYIKKRVIKKSGRDGEITGTSYLEELDANLPPIWWPKGVIHCEPHHTSRYERSAILAAAAMWNNEFGTMDKLFEQLQISIIDGFQDIMSAPKSSILNEIIYVLRTYKEYYGLSDNEKQRFNVRIYVSNIPVDPGYISFKKNQESAKPYKNSTDTVFPPTATFKTTPKKRTSENQIEQSEILLKLPRFPRVPRLSLPTQVRKDSHSTIDDLYLSCSFGLYDSNIKESNSSFVLPPGSEIYPYVNTSAHLDVSYNTTPKTGEKREKDIDKFIRYPKQTEDTEEEEYKDDIYNQGSQENKDTLLGTYGDFYIDRTPFPPTQSSEQLKSEETQTSYNPSSSLNDHLMTDATNSSTMQYSDANLNQMFPETGNYNQE